MREISSWTEPVAMTTHLTPTVRRLPPQILPLPPRAGVGVTLPLAPFRDGVRGGLLIFGSLLFVALIALLDYATGPNLSLSIFYLIPVAACAWWGGFPHGILLSLTGAVTWHAVDLIENPMIPPGAGVWNGIVRFGTLTLISSLVSRLHASVLREHLLARTDPLTGAANGRTFYEAATAEAERAGRSSQPLTLAYLDLDNFKQLNDQLGHAAGDAALVHVVRSIHPNMRTYDVLARLGGDEFALLLPETDGDGASALLDRLQQVLTQELARAGWPVTLSVGAVTFLRPAGDVDLMIQRVDALMYRAKRKGKGRVEHTVLEEETWYSEEEGRGIERRATARILCDHPARVRREVGESAEEFATICDIADGGIGLHMDDRLPSGTLLLVECLLPGSTPLLARVVHVVAEQGKWRHGCQLPTRMAVEEIRRWLGERPEACAVQAPLV
jgi:diguanylate cyclase (GGDEF)-like protein